MKRGKLVALAGGTAILVSVALGLSPRDVRAEEQQAAQSAAEQAPEPLRAEELEILVARIALYPDELVAAILAASIYPVQIVQADRYLEQSKSKKDLKPNKSWDGSVISLLNYPEILGMMNDDLDWTEALGQAVTNQQKDLLQAIQQLRDRAVAQGVLKSDDKTKVVQQNNKVVIQPASANKIYVPVYQPEMLYVPTYVPVPVTYYAQPYPSYYYPTAPYFAGFVTGAVWGAVVDWDDWGVWGGSGNWGNDINIDCNNCFNNNDFNGNINWNDVDWSNVDRNKISFDNSQFNKLDSKTLRDGLQANSHNSLAAKTGDLRRNEPAAGSGKADSLPRDIRNSALKELKKNPATSKPKAEKKAGKLADKTGKSSGNYKPKASNRPAGKPKPGGQADLRSSKPSPIGDVARGREVREFSNRGGRSMGGGEFNRGSGGGNVRRRGRR